MALPDRDLPASVLENLKDQHYWTDLRPAPKRLYIHPDEQIEAIDVERDTGAAPEDTKEPEYEWVLPVHLHEDWSLRRFADVFDAIEAIPPRPSRDSEGAAELGPSGKDWRGEDRKKRLTMAIVADDSTVSYYIVHDGIVKPRQN
ncbi:unnamed protein product [Parascedosporium putredinis]|uniref:tRNA-splicing endonuclease subunit Sen15 domain-containing protein n=1 Tax=Parascedosporium putredinis TaxID=1442378 RepID=A0A9P1ME15_9PEZI|nr:unnamed protein product [Parascedosporium putredinis]CAI8003764.1 unnamed protein product [Parascedosporium putredinis]